MTPANQLRKLLEQPTLHLMPCCFDALSAKLIEQQNFPLTFMSGFSSAAARRGEPDLGLMSYGEVIDQVRNITETIKIPLMADGDTGYGNAMNVRRTVKGFSRAGCAAIMIEDQVSPKRCGHTLGKEVVSRDEAFDRIKAAVDAREEGNDILILARTDARHQYGLNEAIERAAMFKELGADILFIEAPQHETEMRRICEELPFTQMANILEGGVTPCLPPDELQDMGYSIAAYPLTLLSAAMKAMLAALDAIKQGKPADNLLLDFKTVRERVGFDQYYEVSNQYQSSQREEIKQR